MEHSHSLLYRTLQHRSSHVSMSSPNSNNQEKPKSSKFDRAIDDFVGKRYGAGEKWYGKMTSQLSDQEVIDMENKRLPKLDVKDEDIKTNAILIVGDTDSLDAIGDWVAFDLSAKGFNIRVSSSDLTKTIELFGLPGNNVDILPLSPSDIDDSFLKALSDVQALILVGNFNPKLFGSSNYDEYFQIANKLIDLAKKHKGKSVSDRNIDLKKITMVSRYLFSDEENNQPPPQLLSSLIETFTDDQPLPSSLGLFDAFRKQHRDIENCVRSSGIEYSIIRAPERVLESRRGAIFPIKCSQSVQDKGLGYISSLDLAEAVVQSLLIDVDGITFTAEEVDSNSSSALPRVSRDSYYSILSMDEDDMRSSYMIKPRFVIQQYCYNFIFRFSHLNI